jgi:hypothetical protein
MCAGADDLSFPDSVSFWPKSQQDITVSVQLAGSTIVELFQIDIREVLNVEVLLASIKFHPPGSPVCVAVMIGCGRSEDLHGNVDLNAEFLWD